MSDALIVTVLIPARNEGRDIERCLRAVLAQDYPHGRMEIILVDGGCTDGTTDIARQLLEAGDVRWQIVHNSPGTTPSNLNAGLALAAGDIVCRIDARSIVPPHYVRTCVEVLSLRPEVAVTGGAQVAIAPTNSAVGRGIARALNNRFAMGGARYRSGGSSGPTDTVYLGAFRSSELRLACGWDEAMLTNQDFELNRRLGRERVVWFDDRLPVQYVPRSTLRELWKQYHRFGRWKVRYWRHARATPEPRQQLLLIAPIAAGIAVLQIGSRRPAIAALGAVAALVFVEDLGGPPGLYQVPDRIAAQTALLVVSLGWWTGVVVELLRGDGDRGLA